MWNLSPTNTDLMNLNKISYSKIAFNMKRNFSLWYALTALVLLIAGCKKYEFDQTPDGEAVGDFVVTAPASNSSILLNAAIPNDKIIMSWNPAKPGISAAVKYTWIASLKNKSIDTPAISILSDNNGASAQLSVTHKQLDDALKAIGIADGAKADLQWSVLGTNDKNGKTRAGNIFNLAVTRFGDGATPFDIYSPQSSETTFEIDPGSTTSFFNFRWQKSTPAKAANAVAYKVVFVERKFDNNGLELPYNFNSPLFEFNSRNNGADTVLNLSYKQWDSALNSKGMTDLTKVGKFRWTVVATSGNFKLQSKYDNVISVLRQVKFFLVGSFTGWDINAPMELVVDKKSDRFGKVYYTYLRLNQNDAFKFVKTKGDWGSAYGNTGGTNGNYTTGFNQGGDFTIPATGIYRLTIDIANNKAYVQQKEVGIVGDMQSPSWDPPTHITGGYYGPNKFLIVTNSAVGNAFKLHDGTEWDNSTPAKARWWGLGNGAGNLDVDGNGGNLTASSTPRTRVIWDGTNPQQVKYEMYPAVEMRVVGDGLQGVNQWDPPTSPTMTYVGNGRWQITLNLLANKSFKFVAGNAWGAFDYEDATGGKIKWDGGGDFKTPATAGSYTITLDEHAGTYSIN